MNGLPRGLAHAIAQATGARFVPAHVKPVGGGCIHTALEIAGDTPSGGRTYFAKVNDAQHAAMFAAEADGLEALRAAGAVRVPATVAQGDDGEHAWLVLEWLELEPLAAGTGARLGAALAAQHRVRQAKFGWPRDNFIGSSRQANGETDDWLAFWRDKRLHAQLMLAARNRLPSRLIDRGERLAADCGAFFRGHAVQPSLLHGDLWSGNAAASRGEPVVFDPAVYVGDREADVAMTGLFGGFPVDFLSAYRAHWPLDDGYRVRRDLYNLYHVLNHSNLFAGDYVRQAGHQIEQLLAQIG
ncbi:MAG TPA: fructosamine kinase family protein [Usitatibacter sp.]|nr:fructosamine kinase family protein [Usitatibacter sp.]